MTQFITLNVKLSHSQFNKLKSGKIWCRCNFECWIGDSNDETIFSHKISLHHQLI